MSASADIKVLPVHRGLIAQMWPHALPHLERGAAVGKIDAAELLADLWNVRTVLWCVFKDGQITAAYFSSIHEGDAEGRFLMVYGLGGTDVRAWLPDLVETMEEHAKANRCDRACFHGAPAWARLVPQYTKLPATDGAALFERVLQ